jgi:ADP-ribosyl-[dinitrogen reductase] hydrolase
MFPQEWRNTEMTNVLLGGAIGDALGVPFESKPANNPLLLAWDQESFLGSEHHKLLPGQYSDDTMMSLAVAGSLIDNNGFDPVDLAKRYVELFTSNTIRGYGTTTFLAIANLIQGKHYSESGMAGSWGNGTAMRAAPFGIYLRHDLKTLIEACRVDAQITHASDEAIAGSIAIALAAAYATNGDTDNLIEKIVPHLPDSKVKTTLHSLDALLGNPKISSEMALRALGTKADVRETVPATLYCFLRFDNYREAVLAAIKAGGDTDTTASIVGALFGAKSGMQNILPYWVSQVEDSSKLMTLDSQLYNRSNGSFLMRS